MKDIESLTKEIDTLKEKLNKKSEKLKKLNKRLIYYKQVVDEKNIVDHIRYLERNILKKLTYHIDYDMYELTYEFDSKVYTEYVESYGLKWMQEALCIHVGKRHNAIVYPYSLRIISSNKM